MSKSNWKKIIESKIDDGWSDLDSSTPIEVFTNKEKYTIELLVGDSEWDDCDELTPIENMKNFINFKDYKYRYKLKPLAPIQITDEILTGLFERHHSKDFTMDNKEFIEELTERYGREVVIL